MMEIERAFQGNDEGDESGANRSRTCHGGRVASAFDEDDLITFSSDTTVKASNMDPNRPERDPEWKNPGAGDRSNRSINDNGRSMDQNGIHMNCSSYCKQLCEVATEVCRSVAKLCGGVAKLCGGTASSLLDFLEAFVNPSGLAFRRQDSTQLPDDQVPMLGVLRDQASSVSSSLTTPHIELVPYPIPLDGRFNRTPIPNNSDAKSTCSRGSAPF